MEEGLFRRIVDEFAEIKTTQRVGHVIFCYMGSFSSTPAFSEDRVRSEIRPVLVIQTNAYLLTPEDGSPHGNRVPRRNLRQLPRHHPAVYRNVMGLDIGPVLRNVDYLLADIRNILSRFARFRMSGPWGGPA
jgi:hypothetical protein